MKKDKPLTAKISSIFFIPASDSIWGMMIMSAALLPQDPHQNGADGGAHSALKLRVAAALRASQAQERQSSEDGRSRKRSGRGARSNGVVSLHCEGQRSDMVLVSSEPGRRSDFAVRSSWIEPALL